MEMPDVIYISTHAWDNGNGAVIASTHNIYSAPELYHHDRVLKSKDARIAELEAIIESRGM